MFIIPSVNTITHGCVISSYIKVYKGSGGCLNLKSLLIWKILEGFLIIFPPNYCSIVVGVQKTYFEIQKNGNGI